MELVVVFNNFCMLDHLLPAWGMSAVVDTGKEKVLFDTGLDRFVYGGLGARFEF